MLACGACKQAFCCSRSSNHVIGPSTRHSAIRSEIALVLQVTDLLSVQSNDTVGDATLLSNASVRSLGDADKVVRKCSYCGQSDLDPKVQLKKCAGCKAAQYCSEGYQRAAWKSGHMNHCKMIEK